MTKGSLIRPDYLLPRQHKPRLVPKEALAKILERSEK